MYEQSIATEAESSLHTPVASISHGQDWDGLKFYDNSKYSLDSAAETVEGSTDAHLSMSISTHKKRSKLSRILGRSKLVQTTIQHMTEEQKAVMCTEDFINTPVDQKELRVRCYDDVDNNDELQLALQRLRLLR